MNNLRTEAVPPIVFEAMQYFDLNLQHFGFNDTAQKFEFSGIRTENGEIRSISPYSAQMRENAYQNNSE